LHMSATQIAARNEFCHRSLRTIHTLILNKD
jgi:hypothetical protein